jgi:hypothetical protein
MKVASLMRSVARTSQIHLNVPARSFANARLTKIVATIGPVSEDAITLPKVVGAGIKTLLKTNKTPPHMHVERTNMKPSFLYCFVESRFFQKETEYICYLKSLCFLFA